MVCTSRCLWRRKRYRFAMSLPRRFHWMALQVSGNSGNIIVMQTVMISITRLIPVSSLVQLRVRSPERLVLMCRTTWRWNTVTRKTLLWKSVWLMKSVSIFLIIWLQRSNHGVTWICVCVWSSRSLITIRWIWTRYSQPMPIHSISRVM